MGASANNAIAEVSDTPPTKGLVRGVAVGNTTIFATFKGVQGSATVTVTNATLTSIVVTPPISTLPKGTTVQLTATCNLSDLTTQNCTNEVGWTSNDEASAQVSNATGSQGLVTAIAVGSTATTITATLNISGSPLSGTASVTVTPAVLKAIAVVPANPSIPLGLTKQLQAAGFYSDNSVQDLTTEVSWTADNAGIATVSNEAGSQGLVTTGGNGQTTGSTAIEAMFNGIQGSTTVNVTKAILTSIVVAPKDPSLPPNLPNGTTVQLIATCNFSDGTNADCSNDPDLSWTSGNNAVAQVSNLPDTPGVVTGKSVGGASITAKLGSVSGSTTVSVTPATLVSINVVGPAAVLTIAKGTTVQLRAIGVYSDKTTQDITSQASWTAAGGAPPFASVDPLGLITGLNPGSATITATEGTKSGSNTVTVTAALLESIAITPANFSIPNGATQIMTATGTFSDQSTQDLTSSVDWVVSNGLGTVDSTGLLTATAAGPGTITATQPGTPPVSGTTNLTVTDVTLVSIEVTPAVSSVAPGSAVHLSATCNYSAGPAHDCTAQVDWVSLATGTATVDTSPSLTPGLVHGVSGGGPITITATLGTITGTAMVTVTAATVTSIEVLPANQSVVSGTNGIHYTAIAHFNDGTSEDVTAIAAWTSSNTNVAQVKTNQGNSNGEVNAKQTGTATITATVPSLGNASGFTTIHVT